MIRKGLLGATLAAVAMSAMHMAADDDPWAELDARKRKAEREPEPEPRSSVVASARPAFTVTADDRARIRDAEAKRRRQAARQAKGMTGDR